MGQARQKLGKWRQFSLKWLVVLLGALAIGLAAWKWQQEPPWYQNLEYQKAKAAPRFMMPVGPNTISIASVARNQRDGSLVVSDGKGNLRQLAVPNQKQLAQCAPWLDCIQVELNPGPESIEVVELRVFDHNTRQTLTKLDSAFSHRIVSKNVVHIYGRGKLLPETLDVWIRVHSFEKDNQVVLLPPVLGTMVRIAEHDIAIKELQPGYAGWDSRRGLFPVGGTHHHDFSMVLEHQSPGPLELYLVAATTTDRRFRSWSHPRFDGKSGVATNFDTKLGDVDHFEVRLWSPSEFFFFNGLQIPKAQSKPGPPPVVTLPLQKLQSPHRIPELAPLNVSVYVSPGEYAQGISGEDVVPHPNGPSETDSKFSIISHWQGISQPSLRFRYRLKSATQFVTSPTQSYMRSASDSNGGSADVYPIALDDVAEIEIRITE